MQIKILGCSGGIGAGSRTTSMLVDHDVLIDAGTGVGDLSLEELLKIDHIFVTHAHLDHIAFIPLLLDTVMGIRSAPVTVHANKETLETLRQHIFNWKVWPNFNVIPNAENPFLLYNEVNLDVPVVLRGRKFTPLPTNHVIPAVGYHVDSGNASLAFTADTTVCDELWASVNQIQNLKYLIIETAFSNSELALAELSKHLCPSLLLAELEKLSAHHTQNALEIYITHHKPGEGETIMHEIAAGQSLLPIKALVQQHVFQL